MSARIGPGPYPLGQSGESACAVAVVYGRPSRGIATTSEGKRWNPFVGRIFGSSRAITQLGERLSCKLTVTPRSRSDFRPHVRLG